MANELGKEIGQQWREHQNTRSQLGRGGTIVWVENYIENITVDTMNVEAWKSYGGSHWVVEVSSCAGSIHEYSTMDRLNSGSFYGGCGSTSGSLYLVTGSISGSWISPILYYNSSEGRLTNGSSSDSGSNTWRHLTMDYGGSVLVSVMEDDTTIIGSFDSTGSDDMENLSYLPSGSDIRLQIELGSPTSWAGSIVLAFKPSEVGSEGITGDKLVETRIYKEYHEDFFSLGSIDSLNSNGSLDSFNLETATDDFSSTTKMGDTTAYWDTANSKLKMADSSSHSKFYSVYSNIGSLTGLGSVISAIEVTADENKWGGDTINYFVSTSGETGPWEEVQLDTSHNLSNTGSIVYCKVLFSGNGAEDTYIENFSADLKICGGYILYPNTQVQSKSLGNWSLTKFNRVLLESTGSDIADSVDFYASVENSDSFKLINRGIEKTFTTTGSVVKWKAVYNQDSGSAVIDTVDITYKGDDY